MSGRCYIGAGQGDESEKTYPSATDQHAQNIRLAHSVPADSLQSPSVEREIVRAGGKK